MFALSGEARDDLGPGLVIGLLAAARFAALLLLLLVGAPGRGLGLGLASADRRRFGVG